ncbi:hypothetical protein [Actinokineospora sp. UTMC 2448]|uniref:hypothetical protein n=1 Tax=Actinokineospora sp. UTMC 2448 TaxID=2268449 RepID=UPI0021640174|nr:hypothetical protein [Actinokineospora sp. UTMC 2448]
MDKSVRTILTTGCFLSIAVSGCSSDPDAAQGLVPVTTTSTTTTTSLVTTTTTTTTVPSKPTVQIVCLAGGTQNLYTVSTAKDFVPIWEQGWSDCSASRNEAPLGAAEQKALKTAGYDQPEDLDLLYERCVALSEDYEYSSSYDSFTPEEMAEISGALLLCPNHPAAKQVTAAIKKSKEDADLRAAKRLFGSGVYRVGEEVAPGTYAIEGDTANCYWERQDRNGEIIDNNFIGSAKRVQVTIRGSDYAFSSDGCGEWRPA